MIFSGMPDGSACMAVQSQTERVVALAEMMRHAPSAMVLTDRNASVQAWNRRAQEALPGLPDSEVLAPFRPWIHNVANTDSPLSLRTPNVGHLTGWRICDDLIMLQRCEVACLTEQLAEIERRHLALQNEAARLRKLAQNDHLTGLLNASAFAEHCSARVLAGAPGVLLYLDLDGFKPVNDHYGHAAGDHVLRVISERLTETLRTRDLVARLGGDEFGIWLDGYKPEGLNRLVPRLRQRVSAPIDWREAPLAEVQHLRVAVSVGVAASDGSATEFNGLMALADAAMYADKRARKRA